jgi:hypothetical protein
MSAKARAILLVCFATVVFAAAAPGPASADFGLHGLDFRLEEEDGSPATRAGSHPFSITTAFSVNSKPDAEQGELPEGALKDLRIELPPGLVGDRDAVPTCSAADFATIVNAGTSCADRSAVGFADLRIALPFEQPATYRVGVYNLVPSRGSAAKFGFVALGVPVTFDAGVNPDPLHNLYIAVENIAQPVRFFSSSVTIWGNPASPVHDGQRGRCATSGASCHVDLPERPLLTLPRACGGPLPLEVRARSWQEPGVWLSYPIASASGMSCPKIGGQGRIRQM